MRSPGGPFSVLLSELFFLELAIFADPIYPVDSGHGGQIPNRTGTEDDGNDEGEFHAIIFAKTAVLTHNVPVLITSDTTGTDVKSLHDSCVIDNVRFGVFEFVPFRSCVFLVR